MVAVISLPRYAFFAKGRKRGPLSSLQKQKISQALRGRKRKGSKRELADNLAVGGLIGLAGGSAIGRYKASRRMDTARKGVESQVVKTKAQHQDAINSLTDRIGGLESKLYQQTGPDSKQRRADLMSQIAETKAARTQAQGTQRVATDRARVEGKAVLIDTAALNKMSTRKMALAGLGAGIGAGAIAYGIKRLKQKKRRKR